MKKNKPFEKAKSIYRAEEIPIHLLPEPRQNSEELLISRIRYRRLFETSQDGILIVNHETGEIIDANPYILDLLDTSLEKLQNKRLWEIGLFNDSEQSKQAFESLKRNFSVRYSDILLQRSDGKILDVEFTGNTFEIQDRIEIQCNIKDISIRKKAEEELHKSEERFKILVEGVKDYAIFMLDPDGYIISWNLGAERIKGYKANEIMGKHFSIFYPQSEIDKKVPWDELVVASREGRFEDKGWRIRKDGSRFWANVIITALQDENGNLKGFGKVTRDITDQMNAEKEIRLLNESLEQRVKERTLELEKMNHMLQELNATKDKFFSIIAHDLKNPFSGLLGITELLSNSARDYEADTVELLSKQAYESSQHIYRLLENLLAWANAQTGKIEFKPEIVNLKVLFMQNLVIIENLASKKNIKVSLKAHSDMLVLGDANLINIVLRNLLSNAVKFTNPKGFVELSAEEKDEYVEISIKDTGTGISKENMNKLFRIDSGFHMPGTAKERGTGLGLLLCKEFVEKQGGKIWAESEPDKGSKFTFTLPKYDPSVDERNENKSY